MFVSLRKSPTCYRCSYGVSKVVIHFESHDWKQVTRLQYDLIDFLLIPTGIVDTMIVDNFPPDPPYCLRITLF